MPSVLAPLFCRSWSLMQNFQPTRKDVLLCGWRENGREIVSLGPISLVLGVFQGVVLNPIEVGPFCTTSYKI